MFGDFADVPKCARATFIHCCVSRCVSSASRGSGEFGQQFGFDGHWPNDVTYRVHMALLVCKKSMEPLTWSGLNVSLVRL